MLCRGKQDQREPLPEQHGHPEAALGGGLRLFQRPDDSDQGQAPEGLHVLSVQRRVHAVPVRHGQQQQRCVGQLSLSACLPHSPQSSLYLIENEE